MVHENIWHPDNHESERHLAYKKLETERDHFRAVYESACDDLRSIYELAEAGEPVYFVRPDGTKLYLKALKDALE